ncbi:MAG: hypothetical protein JO106_14640 [Mycobacterium sp.]|nr:hypothetical protein [Mycobacterium sp.]
MFGAAERKGYLLRKSGVRNAHADDYGLYVLVDDCKGNRRPGAQAPRSAFAKGEGMPLIAIEAELASL